MLGQCILAIRGFSVGAGFGRWGAAFALKSYTPSIGVYCLVSICFVGAVPPTSAIIQAVLLIMAGNTIQFMTWILLSIQNYVTTSVASGIPIGSLVWPVLLGV